MTSADPAPMTKTPMVSQFLPASVPARLVSDGPDRQISARTHQSVVTLPKTSLSGAFASPVPPPITESELPPRELVIAKMAIPGDSAQLMENVYAVLPHLLKSRTAATPPATPAPSPPPPVVWSMVGEAASARSTLSGVQAPILACVTQQLQWSQVAASASSAALLQIEISTGLLQMGTVGASTDSPSSLRTTGEAVCATSPILSYPTVV
jgi:hypothetical protein